MAPTCRGDRAGRDGQPASALRLAAHGARVLTSLAGRSAASAARAAKAGMEAMGDDAALVADGGFHLLGHPAGRGRRVRAPLRPGASPPAPRSRSSSTATPSARSACAKWRRSSRPPAPPSSMAASSAAPPSRGTRRRAHLCRRTGRRARAGAARIRARHAAGRGRHRRGLGAQMQLCRAHQGDAGAGRGADPGGDARGRRRRLAPGIRREPARARRVPRAPDPQHVSQGLSLGRRDGGDRRPSRHQPSPAARDIYRGMARLYEHLGTGGRSPLLDEFLER